MSIIKVERLSKSFEYYEKELGFKNSLRNLLKRKTLTKEAVSEISFEIEHGEMVGFLGPVYMTNYIKSIKEGVKNAK